MVVQCGPGFKLALTTGEERFGRLSPVCGDCLFRIVKCRVLPLLERPLNQRRETYLTQRRASLSSSKSCRSLSGDAEKPNRV